MHKIVAEIHNNSKVKLFVLNSKSNLVSSLFFVILMAHWWIDDGHFTMKHHHMLKIPKNYTEIISQLFNQNNVTWPFLGKKNK